MKGQAKRFVDHKGTPYETEAPGAEPEEPPKKTQESNRNDNIGFFDLWRYSTLGERVATLASVLLSLVCAMAVIAAVAIYGELTALFVTRHRALPATQHARILALFGGGRSLPAGDRALHMDALVEDSLAFALASAAIMLVQWVTAMLGVSLAQLAARAATDRLRQRLLRQVLRQEVAFFDTNTTFNFAATLTEDMEKLRAGIGEHVAMTSYLLGSVVAGACLALAYGAQLAALGLAFVPAAILVALVVAKYQTRSSEAEVAAYSAAARGVEEALANVRTVRAYSGEHVEAERYRWALVPGRKAALRRGVWSGLGTGLGWLLTYLMNAAVFAFGAALCVRDMELPPELQQYHPGVMVTVLFCTFMAAQNVAMCHPHLEIFSSARGAAKSIYWILERSSSIDAMRDEGHKPEQFRGDIHFNNVYFNYPSRPDVKVLRGLTLSVSAGETVALVGGSGCGKSTLLQLLQSLYTPQCGCISIDGHQLTHLNLHHYRTSIGVVGQEPVLFSGTIRENIAMGVQAPHEDIIAAAKTAHAHAFISKLADGYDTMLGERGAQLSGGQKQRIAIARAVLRKPALLLLDEPTSALDPAAERSVQAALDAAALGRTTIVVSHRLSTVANADRIVVLEQGSVLEQGAPHELLAARGAYWKLHTQDDLTGKSIAALPPADRTTKEVVKEEVVEKEDVVFTTRTTPFQRSHSTVSAASSLCRDNVIRGSRRLGSAPRLAPALPPPPPEDHQEEDSLDVPPVSLRSLALLVRPEWGVLAGGGAASFLVGATMPIFALLFSKLYGMFASSDGEEILRESRLYATLFGLVAMACGALTFLQAFLFTRAGANLTDRLRTIIFDNYLKQEQGWFDLSEHSVGALCARLATDAAAVQGATGPPLGALLQGVSTMALGVGLALPYSWKMTLVSLVSVPCVIGGIWAEGAVGRRTEAESRRALQQAANIATEAVINVRTVQSLGIEQSMLSRYSAALVDARARTARLSLVRGAVHGVCLCAPTLGYAVSLAYGGYLIAREGLQYQYAILVSEALIYGAWMLAEALSFAPSFASARRAAARVVAAIEAKPSIRTEDTAVHDPNWTAKGDISFSSLEFQYPTRPTVPVLRGLSLEVKRGDTVALVGASGCGKSTLMHLLLRSYDPATGTIKLDSRDIKRSLPLPTLRGQLGLVQQEPALFSRSLKENIAYGDNNRNVTMEEIIDAAKQANVHQFISSLPMGYDTPLGGGGATLSGGQKQRVAIARALIRKPAVLLLDEATSALDATSEKTVQAALEAASSGRTTLVIAHRLATVRNAHTICVIHNGVVAEKGSHEELVHKRGLYYELLQQQAPMPAAQSHPSLLSQ